jgi:hypothetical protein
LVAIDVSDPLAPKIIATVPMQKPTSVAVQFRYAFVTDADGLKVVDVTVPAAMKQVGALVAMPDARNVFVSRHYAYVGAGRDGVAIVDVTTPTSARLIINYDADGRFKDTNQVKIGMINDSVYGLVADGTTGFHVMQLVTPEDGGRSAYGFSPSPRPKWISSRAASGARAIAKGLDRDRAVDESGNQVSVFGRIGGRPFTLEEQRSFYMRDGKIFTVSDEVPSGWQAPSLDSLKK